MTLSLLVAATVGAAPASRDSPAPATFTYKTAGTLPIKADVYRLAGDEMRPVVLWIHGGALIFGSRRMLPADERDRFLQAGYVVVAIDYRLAPETKLPEILADVVDAHRWIESQGPALFRGDPRRVVAVGQSGGAYLALMAAATVRPRLKAVVSFYGYGALAETWYTRPSPFYLAQPRVPREQALAAVAAGPVSEGPPEPRSDFYVYCRQTGLWPRSVTGFDPAEAPQTLALYAPEQLVTAEYPPTLLLHGDRDVDVPFEMSERMAAVLQRHGVEHRLERLAGFNHMFDVFPDGFPPAGPPKGLSHPTVSAAFDRVLAFLARHTAHQ